MKMSKFVKDITGNRYGRLVVMNYAYSKPSAYWLCKCDCGKEKVIHGADIKNCSINSCGCIHKEQLINRNKSHLMSNTSTYKTWNAMLTRCNNKKATGYSNYGGRGIKICKRWLKFDNFYADMGKRPKGMFIERKDNDGNYCPSNCKWATRKEQQRNTNRNIVLEARGKKMILSDWCKELGICFGTLYGRLFKLGWDVESALFKPIRKIKGVHY